MWWSVHSAAGLQATGVQGVSVSAQLVAYPTRLDAKIKGQYWSRKENIICSGYLSGAQLSVSQQNTHPWLSKNRRISGTGFRESCKGVGNRGRWSSQTIFRPVAALGESDISELNPSDVELLFPIGELSLQKMATLGRGSSLDSDPSQKARLAEWTESEPTPSVKVYAARLINGEGAGEQVVLKEYPPAAASMGLNELRVYGRLQETRTWFGASQAKDTPILSLLGFFITEAMPEGSWERQANAQEGFAEVQSQPVVPLDQQIVQSALRRTGLGGEEQLSTWLVFQWEALRAASFFPSQPQTEGVMSILNPFKSVFPRRRADFLKSAVRGALEAVAYCHVRGVVHGAVSLSCIILSTFDEREADTLSVRLASFGLGEDLSMGIEGLEEDTIDTCRQFGASSALDILSMLRRLDLYYLGLALLELVFSSLAKGGPSERTSSEALRRLWEGVFALDVKAIRAFCAEDKEWEAVVEFLDENDGSGWELFAGLLKFQGIEADEVLKSNWFNVSPQ